MSVIPNHFSLGVGFFGVLVTLGFVLLSIALSVAIFILIIKAIKALDIYIRKNS